jgi:hypothetical protein
LIDCTLGGYGKGKAISDLAKSWLIKARQILLMLPNVILPTAARVYIEMGGAGGNADATQSIAGYILTKGLQRLVISDLTTNIRACRGQSADEVRRLVSPREAGGWLKPEKDFGNTKWLVSPLVHERFTERARRESEHRQATLQMILGEAEHRRWRNQEDQEYDE